MAGDVTPFVDDDEEQDDSSLYAADSSDDSQQPQRPSNEDEPQRVGPDGDGDASTNNGSAMPQYSPQQSGSTSPDNTSPALSGKQSSGADPLSGSLYEPPPAAPTYQAPDRSQYKTDRSKMQQDQAPLDRSQYRPTLKNRILGGIVGALGEASGGNADRGHDIVHQRYANAAADQTTRVAADKDAVAGDRTDISDNITDQDKENEFYKTGLDTYNANRGAQAQQWDRDRTNRQDTQAQTNWNQSDREHQQEQLYTHQQDVIKNDRADREEKEKNRHTGVDEGYEGRRVTVDEKREKADETTGGDDGLGGSPSDQRIRAQNAYKYEGTRKDAFNRIAHGDPKAADEYGQRGYEASLKDLQTRPDNPDSGEPWKPGEQDAAVKAMNQRHLDDLNKVESDYVGGMRGMGYKNIQPVQFNDRGEAVTDSSGRPIQKQGAGGQQQPGPQGGQGGPPAKPSPGTPAQQPQTFKTKSGPQVSVGQVVSIGGKPVRITGFNQQTGKPTGVPVGQ